MSINNKKNQNKKEDQDDSETPKVKEITLEERALANSANIVKIVNALSQNANVINQTRENVQILDEKVKLFKESLDLLKERIEIEILKNKK